jgi:hypothetical protein
MSRYVHVAVAVPELAALAELLKVWGHEVQWIPNEKVMLEGSLECTGEPVDLRLPAGTSGAVEDFGFNQDEGRLELVCSDVDRDRLVQELLRPALQELSQRRLRTAADQLGMAVEDIRESDGTRRLVLRRSSE